ncbi:MAG TPA: hypothetical protein VFN67_16880 [Polyangiales bacterium]|nr:hypothetical protein [Polyangiales bacterium]
MSSRLGVPQHVLLTALTLQLSATGCQSDVPDVTLDVTATAGANAPPMAAAAPMQASAPMQPSAAQPKVPVAEAASRAMPASTMQAPVATTPPTTPPAKATEVAQPTQMTPGTPAMAPATQPTASETAKTGFVRGAMPTPASASTAGPYKVEQLKDGVRNGPAFGGATIYYPTDAEPPLAMIVFCPGYLGTQASDAPWGSFMASHGIVFMNIDTNTPGDSVLQRQEAELDALKSLQEENTRDGSPLKGKLALDRAGLMGWSMGGGGAWLNGTEHPELKTLITLAGHNATAGGASPLREISVPTLMLAGTADTAILGLGMSQPVYDVIPDSTPKLLYEINGADHFDFNDPAFAEGIPARYALSWEKVYLEGDMRYYQFLLEKGENASDFRSNLK